MDSDGVKCCDCGCNCSSNFNRSSLLETTFRSVKRKFNEDEDEDEQGNSKFVIPGLSLPQINARVGVENECAVLREMVSNQLQTIQDLSLELEEERNASSSAANEAMSMILRLQGEKSEIQMEARQFKRFAEEKMEHDQQEFVALEDFLYKKEEEIQSLSCEVQMYKHRMMSFGLSEGEAKGDVNENGGRISRNQSMSDNLDGQFESLTCDYPTLRCNLTENQFLSEVENEAVDVEKYASGETPRPLDQLKELECRIYELENTPRNIQPEGGYYGNQNVLEKVIIDQSPRHRRKCSSDSCNSSARGAETKPESPKLGSSFSKTNYSHPDDYCDSGKGDYASDVGDESSDRVYTIDSVHPGTTPKYGIAEPKAFIGLCDDYVATPQYSHNDPDIQKLYARLQALEADRESMRQSIISMQTDKAQLVLLKKIAQEFFKERPPPQLTPVRKPSLIGRFSFISAFKWIASIVFWRGKARGSKYVFGLSSNNAGLLMLLDKGQKIQQQGRCISSRLQV